MATTLERPAKRCFVTVGATAAFTNLLTAILSQSFLDALSDAGYTDLVIQYGVDGKSVMDDFQQRQQLRRDDTQTGQVTIKSFDFNRKGLGQEMRAAKAEGGATEGVVISHAGEFVRRSMDGMRTSSSRR